MQRRLLSFLSSCFGIADDLRAAEQADGRGPACCQTTSRAPAPPTFRDAAWSNTTSLPAAGRSGRPGDRRRGCGSLPRLWIATCRVEVIGGVAGLLGLGQRVALDDLQRAGLVDLGRSAASSSVKLNSTKSGALLLDLPIRLVQRGQAGEFRLPCGSQRAAADVVQRESSDSGSVGAIHSAVGVLIGVRLGLHDLQRPAGELGLEFEWLRYVLALHDASDDFLSGTRLVCQIVVERSGIRDRLVVDLLDDVAGDQPRLDAAGLGQRRGRAGADDVDFRAAARGIGQGQDGPDSRCRSSTDL